MASETQSFEMFIPDNMCKKNEKTVIITKKKSLLLIVVIVAAILILGILLTSIFLKLNEFSQEKIELNNKLEKIIGDIKEIKTSEKILLDEKMDSKNSYAHFLKADEFGYFQELEDKMSFFDGQDACKRIKGKIIESNEKYGNASIKLHDVGHRLSLNRKYENYGQGFDVPFYIGLINIGANRDKNQWRWSSTGKSLSKNTLGEETTKIGGWYPTGQSWDWEYKLISWAKGANGLKLHGDCAFINNDAELKDIDCTTKLTIICEEV